MHSRPKALLEVEGIQDMVEIVLMKGAITM